MDISKLIYRLKRKEGCKLMPYLDTEGNWTIGYGYNLTSHMPPVLLRQFLKSGKTWTQQQAEDTLTFSATEAVNNAIRLVENWVDLSDRRQRCLAEMCFNLGPGKFAGFHKMLDAVESSDWDKAAAEILDSKAARQLPERYAELAEMMRVG